MLTVSASYRALGSFLLHFLFHGDGEIVSIHTLEQSFPFLSVGVEHFHFFSDEVEILLSHLERLSEAGAANLQFVVLVITVEVVFYEAAELHAILNPHAICMVDLHDDSVVWTNLNVNEEIVFVLEPLVN